jgi:hypothetical protein
VGHVDFPDPRGLKIKNYLNQSDLFTKCFEWQQRNSVINLSMCFAHMDLVKMGNRCSIFKIKQMWRYGFFAVLALDCKKRFVVHECFGHDSSLLMSKLESCPIYSGCCFIHESVPMAAAAFSPRDDYFYPSSRNRCHQKTNSMNHHLLSMQKYHKN